MLYILLLHQYCCLYVCFSSEDDCVKVWRVTEESEVGDVAKEAAVLKFPPTSIVEREKEKDFLILPILTVNVSHVQ